MTKGPPSVLEVRVREGIPKKLILNMEVKD